MADKKIPSERKKKPAEKPAAAKKATVKAKPVAKKPPPEAPAPKVETPKVEAPKVVAAPKPAKPKAAPAPKRIPEKALKVTQIGSPIGREDYQRATLKGLGLNKLHRSRVLEDTPAVRGMIQRVHHLVRVESAS